MCNAVWGRVSGNRHYPSEGGETDPLWNGLVAAEPSFVSIGRCANNLQHCSPKLRIMQQCDSDEASGTTFVYTGIHTVPRLSHRRGRVCICTGNTESLFIFLLPFPFPLSLFHILCPGPPIPSPWQERTGQWSRLFAACFTVIVWPRPIGTKPAINFNYCQCFCLSTYFSPKVAFCLIQSEWNKLLFNSI